MTSHTRPKLLSALLALDLLFVSGAHSQSNQADTPATIMGFTSASSQKQAALETKLKSMISPEHERDFHRYFTSEPHPAGTEQNHKVAEYIADTWKKQGLEDVVIRQYDVLSSLPKEVSVEMVSPVTYKAGLREAPYDVDPDTRNRVVHSAWLSMSASGEVT